MKSTLIALAALALISTGASAGSTPDIKIVECVNYNTNFNDNLDQKCTQLVGSGNTDTRQEAQKNPTPPAPHDCPKKY